MGNVNSREDIELPPDAFSTSMFPILLLLWDGTPVLSWMEGTATCQMEIGQGRGGISLLDADISRYCKM